MKTSALERFLRYVVIDTRADDSVAACPSSPGQLELARLLETELTALGAAASVDDNGYVMATVAATTGLEHLPAVGFIAHMDTSPERSGTNVRPIVHRAYSGGDIALPDDPLTVIRASENPALLARIGDDIVTASGTTLLGADDKAGIAAILAAVEHVQSHREIPHGPVRICFTPDEEIGRGADHFDLQKFDCAFAYTMDGGSRGELEYESFSADLVTLTFDGFNTHPGYAKGRMVNAIRVAADFIHSLPRERMSPETSDGYEGYLHAYDISAAVDRTVVKVLLRDFRTAALSTHRELVERLAREACDRHPGCRLDVAVREQYRNMREVLDQHPEVVERARAAMRRLGLEPVERPIRGGTDGSRLSFMGLPTPNLFAGEHNFHSRLEWVSAQDMDKAVEVIVELCRVWAEG